MCKSNYLKSPKQAVDKGVYEVEMNSVHQLMCQFFPSRLNILPQIVALGHFKDRLLLNIFFRDIQPFQDMLEWSVMDASLFP